MLQFPAMGPNDNEVGRLAADVEDRLRQFGVVPEGTRLNQRGWGALIAVVVIVVVVLLWLVLSLFGGGGDPVADASEAASAEPVVTPTPTPTPSPVVVDTFDATATVYGPGLEGGVTASGEVLDVNAFTAAHPTLDFGTRVRVTNPANGLQVIVVINDRLADAAADRLDLTVGAAAEIGITVDSGPTLVRMEVLAL